MKKADQVLSEIAATGVDLNKITTDLIDDGVKKFADSFHELINAIDSKMKRVTQ